MRPLHELLSGPIPNDTPLLLEENTKLLECLASALVASDRFDGVKDMQPMADTGLAVLVDLEKCRYGLPGFDLAHASL
ncbi:hypothetical protein L1073_12845 [Chromohalobacter nigrandesensis]|nr:hypothetical protein [Chromohalobacter nigrandesensis]MCK0746008.1 hypothetical protein [Chromohalobacter nigrandesensis]